MAVSVAAALLLGAVFAGDSVWTALAALLVAGGWGALALAGRAPLPGGGGVLVGLLLATAAWSGLSIAWSVAPDLSWVELNRTLVVRRVPRRRPPARRRPAGACEAAPPRR